LACREVVDDLIIAEEVGKWNREFNRMLHIEEKEGKFTAGMWISFLQNGKADKMDARKGTLVWSGTLNKFILWRCSITAVHLPDGKH